MQENPYIADNQMTLYAYSPDDALRIVQNQDLRPGTLGAGTLGP